MHYRAHYRTHSKERTARIGKVETDRWRPAGGDRQVETGNAANHAEAERDGAMLDGIGQRAAIVGEDADASV